MRRLTAKWLMAASAVCVLGIGSAMAQPPPPPYATVPPPRAEMVPPPPGGGRMIWEPGHWHWNGAQYVWFGGHYVERRPNYGHYVPGHWAWSPRLGRYEWIAAHWQ